MARAYSPNEIIQKKYKQLEWGPKWQAAYAKPEATGIWWIGGESQNGKTTFIMELAKELADLKIGKVMINGLEEGTRLTMKENIVRHGMQAYNGRIMFGSETYKDNMARMHKQRAPWALINDSAQLYKMSVSQFHQLMELRDKHLIIFTSHMDGSEPKGTVAKEIKYYADQKILVEGFRATSLGRFNAGGIYTIWEEGAAKYWEGKKIA